ncbi:hypothetical protein ACHAXR_003566 [Thalassiosira sp. AJA248-18]
MRCALALALLCKGVHGQEPAPLFRGQSGNAAEEKERERKASLNLCQDGSDCTSTQCKKILEAEAAKETCAATPSIIAVTSPPSKNLLVEKAGPFCLKFNDSTDTQGFAPCPGIYDNIYVNPSDSISPYDGAPYNDDTSNPLSGDKYLHVRDGSGGSLACGTGADYTGDWSSFTCHDLCFDVKLFHDGCYANISGCSQNADGKWTVDVYPYIILQGGAPGYHRAVFKAYDFMTDPDGSSPDWRRICAPLAPLNSTGNLPSNEFGQWYMAGPNDVLSGGAPISGPPSPESAWPTLLSDITAIQLPIDFTGNPAERAGYDNICMKERDCVDPCDPEPLCYWQHEWSCEDAKKEEWYSNFTDLISPLETFPKKFCICKILEECCADLCDIAEQELMALLLNVASGQVSLDCGVKECDDCVYNVSSVISMVDELLAPSSRSDYDCSKALHLLTGINHDEILCDTPAEPEPCPQTKKCFKNDGTCVPKAACFPSSTVRCEDLCDGEDCTCKMAIPCPQTTKCEDEGGRCIKNCQNIVDAVGNLVVKCKDICSEDDTTDANKCMCEIKSKPCVETTLCESNGGNCVKEEDCAPPSQCNPQFCNFSDGCVCKIDESFPCVDTDECTLQDGECVKDCFPIAGVRQCDPDLCASGGVVDPDACSCKIERCPDVNDHCKNAGGECKVFDDCDPTAFICNPTFCGEGDSDLCVCEIPFPG